MKIVFCKWTSICETGVDHGLQELGHTIIRITRLLDSVDYDMEYANLLADTLREAHADCVFSINFIPIIARVCKIFRVPYLCWIVDSPCFQLYSETICYETNHIFIFDRDLYMQFQPKNPNGIYHHSLAADMHSWDAVTVTDREWEQYHCDISFVGSLYSEKAMYNRIAHKLPDRLRGYAEGLMDAQLHTIGTNILRQAMTPEFVREFKSYANWIPLCEDYEENDLRIVADTYLGYKCTELDRIMTLNALAEHFQVDLYTQSDTAPLHHVRLRGPADSNTMMPQIMKCSKINLNLTNKPISSGLPLRCFDIMGCGGFMLSNYQPELPELFVPEQEVVFYTSIPDLLDKAAYYLAHDDEREAIARRGYEKVKTLHNYATKLDQMFHTVFA